MLTRGNALLTCAALVLTGLVGAGGGTAAAEVTECADSGAAIRYIVLFDTGTSTGVANDRIATACGRTTVYYPEIAVAVATAGSPAFAERFGRDRVFSAQGQRLVEQQASTAEGPADPVITDPLPSSDGGGATDPPSPDRTGEQWDMRAISADLARSVERGDRDVVVGVLDSGIDASHPDLANAVDPTLSAGCLSGAPETRRAAWEPTGSAHGTHVAGIVAAADNGKGITGVAPGVRLASVKVVDDRGYVDPEAAVCGLMWAARHGMTVTNNSYFVTPGTPSCTPTEGFGVVREAITRAADYAETEGTLTVAAATNDAVNLTPSPASPPSSAQQGGCEALPAGLRGSVTVSAVDKDGLKTGYSSYGLGVVDLTAPGGDSGRCVLSTVPGGYASLCGTSMAAPHVTGIAALLAARDGEATPERLRTALAAAATPVACPDDYDLTGNGTQDAYCSGYEGYNGFYGRGMVDALAAVSGQQQPGQPAGSGPDTDAGHDEQIRDVPDHAGIEHTGGKTAHQFDSVVQRDALHDVLQGVGIDRQREEGR
ncbi:serine protease [Prauserella marina]|uniref:Subtilase family protein n=1 Tax=Prauserella marina TaxID=530584 RepID=A0A222VMB8_9PSEU|nr:serine protease [Prauserella marina]PWV85186.1 subtilase family protein [Prauserella marina]SDC02818.1 Subtilase family protein [Prauserella marina]